MINQQSEWVGHAKFKSLSASQKGFLEQKHSILKRKEWQITKGIFHEQEWAKVFQMMIESKAVFLSFFNNKNIETIKPISNITFTNLTTLNLNYNKISSVQMLGNLNAPCLSEIAMSYNKITSIRPIRKICSRNVKSVNISENFVNSLTSMSEISNEVLVEIKVEQWENNHLMGEDLSWAVKTAGKGIKSIICQNKKRVSLIKIRQIIKNSLNV